MWNAQQGRCVDPEDCRFGFHWNVLTQQCERDCQYAFNVERTIVRLATEPDFVDLLKAMSHYTRNLEYFFETHWANDHQARVNMINWWKKGVDDNTFVVVTTPEQEAYNRRHADYMFQKMGFKDSREAEQMFDTIRMATQRLNARYENVISSAETDCYWEQHPDQTRVPMNFAFFFEKAHRYLVDQTYLAATPAAGGRTASGENGVPWNSGCDCYTGPTVTIYPPSGSAPANPGYYNEPDTDYGRSTASYDSQD